MIATTWNLYRAALRDTAGSLRRSGWAVGLLLGGFLARGTAGVLMAPFGLAGGFALGFLHALLIGWYLSLVQIAVQQRRTVRWDDLRDHAGHLFQETLSILFLFSIAQWVLGAVSPVALFVAVPLANFAFNVAPELVWAGRNTGTALLGDAWAFLRENWPEWLVPNALAAAAVTALYVSAAGRFEGRFAIDALQTFGPWFGFLDLPALVTAGFGRPLGLPAALIGGALTHAFVLFRGHLYLALAKGSRRSRAWQARLAGADRR